MITVSPARAQRRARPKPSGPVPPRTAMVRGIIRLTSSCELRFQGFLEGEALRLQPDIDAGVSSVAFGGNASSFTNQRLEIFRAGVLSGGGSGLARDVLFHQGPAIVVRAGMQAKLRQAPVQLHP